MKRTICACLAALMLLTALPAQAVGKGAVKVMGTNGTVTVGIRYQPEYKAEPVYTTDGVHWQAGQAGEGVDMYYATRGYYAGGRFWMYERGSMYGGSRVGYCSDDGVHWRELESDEPAVGWPGRLAQVGKYCFELSEGGHLRVRHAQGNDGISAWLPACEQALEKIVAKDRYFSGFDCVQAYPGPGDTVTVTAYNGWDFDESKAFTAAFTTDSLDWVLENQGSFRVDDISPRVTDGKVTLRLRDLGDEVMVEYSYDDSHYALIPNAPWGGRVQLLPYDGRTFMVRDLERAEHYISQDGVHWRSLRGTYLRPALPGDVRVYATEGVVGMQWTGSEYITCQRYREGRSGMMGSSGGWWYDPMGTKVCFADGDFNLTGAYDFGRQVVGVGYYNGAWYAEVKDDPGMAVNDISQGGGTTLYVSRDKQSWEKTQVIQIMEAVRRF